MTDLSILEDLDAIGVEMISMIQIIGNKVPDSHHRAYIAEQSEYSYYEFDPLLEDGFQEHDYSTFQMRSYTYKSNFRDQFIKEFRDKIDSMGESYFFLDTSTPGVPAFTIQGKSSGIFQLKKEIQTKFPQCRIIEL